MVDDGKRLIYYICSNQISVNDVVNNTAFCCDQDYVAVASLDTESIFNHIKTIEELVLKHDQSWIGFRVPTHDYKLHGVQIIEDAHFKYVINVDGRYAELSDNYFKAQKQFNKTKLLKALHLMYARISHAVTPIVQKTSIVRRFPDIKCCAWCYGGHIVMCNEKNLKMHMMYKCLVDDNYYPFLGVQLLLKNGKEVIQLVDTTGDIVFTCPKDESFMRYFGDWVPVDVEKLTEEDILNELSAE